MPLSKRLRRCLVIVGVIAIFTSCAGLGLRGYQMFEPPDRVRIYVKNIPKGVEFLSLIGSADGEIVNLDWSPNSEIGMPFTLHPVDCIWSDQDPSNPKIDWHAYVRWHPGQRYGVVTRTTNEVWQVAWFEATQVPLRGKRWLLGGGSAEFDLLRGDSEPLPPAKVRILGLQRTDGKK